MQIFAPALITMTTAPVVSTCYTCHRDVGEFCVVSRFSQFGSRMVRFSHRTWPAIQELGAKVGLMSSPA